MKTLLIRNLSESTLEKLKKRAARRRRSLQKEVQCLIEDSVRGIQPDEGPWELPHTVRGKSENSWSRADIYGDDGR